VKACLSEPRGVAPSGRSRKQTSLLKRVACNGAEACAIEVHRDGWPIRLGSKVLRNSRVRGDVEQPS